jgi:hypothetical protein
MSRAPEEIWRKDLDNLSSSEMIVNNKCIIEDAMSIDQKENK